VDDPDVDGVLATCELVVTRFDVVCVDEKLEVDPTEVVWLVGLPCVPKDPPRYRLTTKRSRIMPMEE
jgi:hypothetical protein